MNHEFMSRSPEGMIPFVRPLPSPSAHLQPSNGESSSRDHQARARSHSRGAYDEQQQSDQQWQQQQKPNQHGTWSAGPSTGYATNNAGPMSASATSSGTSRKSPRSPYMPLPPNTFCTATSDRDSFSIVQLAGASSPAGVKERIFAKLKIQDDDYAFCTLWLSQIGGDGRDDKLLSDDELWMRCREAASSPLTVLVKNPRQMVDYTEDLDSAVTLAMRRQRKPSNPAQGNNEGSRSFRHQTSSMDFRGPVYNAQAPPTMPVSHTRRPSEGTQPRKTSDENTRRAINSSMGSQSMAIPAQVQPIRRLPGTPNYDNAVQPTGASSSSAAWSTNAAVPPPMPYVVRPLPEARPTSSGDIKSAPSGYNNLYFQNQYQVQGHHIEYTDPRVKNRSAQSGRYPYTEQEMRSSPLPINTGPPTYRLQAQAALGITRTHPRPPPPPPLQTSFSPPGSSHQAIPARPGAVPPPAARHSPAPTQGFDLRVMRPDSGASTYVPSPRQHPKESSQNSLYRPTGPSTVARPPAYQALEVGSSLTLRPGETLQQGLERNRRLSEENRFLHERAASDTHLGQRRLSSERDGVPSRNPPPSLRPGGDIKSPRDSTSSASSSHISEPIRHTGDDSAYGGIEPTYRAARPVPSVTSSARSSASMSGGPVTPATTKSDDKDSAFFDDFDDDEDEGDVEEQGQETWMGAKRPPAPVETLKSPDAVTSPLGTDSLLLGKQKGDGNWADSLLRSLSQSEGTVTSSSASSTLKGHSSTLTPVSKKSSPGTAVNDDSPKSAFVEDPHFYAPEQSHDRKSDGAFSPTDDFDDDPEGSTFFAGFGPPSAVSATDPRRSPLLDRAMSSSPAATVQETKSDNKKPGLHVKIDEGERRDESQNASQPAYAEDGLLSKSPAMLSRSGRRSPVGLTMTPSTATTTPSTATPSQSRGPGASFTRRGSFVEREKFERAWAVRPPVETVLEQLDVYFPDFPEQDLDKPVFEAPTPSDASAASPTAANRGPDSKTAGTASDKSGAAPVAPGVQRVNSAALNYRKSIRFVAGDKRQTLLKANSRLNKVTSKVTAVSARAALLRRKSTKLFGSRIEEVTSDQMKRMDLNKPESLPEGDPANASFKWIKGDLIGRGTYGRVYFAMNVTLGEPMAVKQVELPKTRSAKEDERQQGMVASLKAEIELLKDLDHPNIVMYLGSQETPEHLSIFLEYVPGGSVGRIVRTHGKFEDNVIRFFTYQILDGLKYLHEQGILHRDLKADNILCDHDGICKISDFGTSKRSNSIYDNQADMSMQGSIFWMAPEVIQNAKQGYSAKADIWSLGCICLEMFAGRRPWSEEEAIQAMFKLGAERQAPPIPDDVDMSDLARHFLGECLRVDATRRPKASQLLRHLYLELPEDWRFSQTALYRAIAEDEKPRKKLPEVVVEKK